MADPQGSGSRLVARLFTVGAVRLFSLGKKFIRPACRDDFLRRGISRHDKPVAGCDMAPPFMHDALQIILEENKICPVVDCGILRGFLLDLTATDEFLRVARAV